jgi:hypothetical protein
MNYKANSFNGEMHFVSQSDRRGVESLDSGLPNQKFGRYGTANVGACFQGLFCRLRLEKVRTAANPRIRRVG